MEELKLYCEDDADPNDIKFLDEKIFEHSFSKIGHYSYKKMILLFRNGNHKIVAGLYGHTGLGWLYIDVLWVQKDLRANGLGTRLIEAAELEAINRGCQGVYLYTYSFQKPVFYEKLGYQIFGQLDDFPDGHSKLFMKKHFLSKGVKKN